MTSSAPAPPLPVVLVGGGGHASDLLGAIEAAEADAPGTWDVVGYVTATPPDGPGRLERRGVRWLGTDDELAAGALDGVDGTVHALLAIGAPAVRAAVAHRLATAGVAVAPPLVHPGALVGPLVTLGAGSVVLGGASVSADVVLGQHAQVSQLVAVGHDVVLGRCSSVYPGAVLGGDVVVGERTMVGSGATVLPRVRIGDDVSVGAGATVTRDVPDGVTAVGVPARW